MTTDNPTKEIATALQITSDSKRAASPVPGTVHPSSPKRAKKHANEPTEAVETATGSTTDMNTANATQKPLLTCQGS
ncbi:hypothetical protein HK102_010551, partial [Quaeritorhiza haematococci]